MPALWSYEAQSWVVLSSPRVSPVITCGDDPVLVPCRCCRHKDVTLLL